MKRLPIVSQSKRLGAADWFVEDPSANLEHMETEDEGECFAGVERCGVGPESARVEVED